MLFELRANVRFEAKSEHQALLDLAAHFRRQAGLKGSLLAVVGPWSWGDISVEHICRQCGSSEREDWQHEAPEADCPAPQDHHAWVD
jgi:hypothetical protein